MSAEVGSAPGLAGAGHAPDMPQRVTTAAQAWCRTRGGGQRSVLRAGTERSVPGVLRCDRERCRAGRKDGMRLRCAQRCTRSLWLPLKVSRRSGPVRLLFATLVECCARRSLSHVQHAVIRCRRRLRPRREGSPGSSGAVLGRAWSASGRWAHVVRHDHHDERFCAPT